MWRANFTFEHHAELLSKVDHEYVNYNNATFFSPESVNADINSVINESVT